jgi:azurin/glucose/arabinose dehydrogenase
MRHLILFVGILVSCLFAQTPRESDFYTLATIPIPQGIELEGGGLCTLPNGNLAVATRHGDVYLIENPYLDIGSTPNYRLFASGLHEALGLTWFDGTLWVSQRGELTRLWDHNGDGSCDFYESVYSWPLSGHYHEYSYGPSVGPDGNLYVTTNVSFGNVEWWRGMSEVPWRGWTLQITPEGKMTPFATGMRSPNSYGFHEGEFFYGDNQGDWMGSGGLVHVERGDFVGHPAGLVWADQPESPVGVRTEDIYSRVDPQLAAAGERPIKPENNDSETPMPLFAVAEAVEGVKLPAVWLPHGVLGISTAQFVTDQTDGAFGPFEGQLFIGDQGQSKVMRIFMEKVEGVYQGAAFDFYQGFQCGIMRMSWGRDGSLFAAESNRGWGSTGDAPYGLQRLVWTGKTPFEIKAIRAMPDGFDLEFTQPVNKASASNPDHYLVSSFTYKYHPVYGSPAVNLEENPIRGVVVSADGLHARLVVDKLRMKYIHEIQATGVRDYVHNQPLLHSTGYYTLNVLPQGEKLNLPPRQQAAATSTNSGGSPMSTAGQELVSPDQKQAEASPQPAKDASVRLAMNQTTLPTSWVDGPDLTVRLGTEPGLKYDVTDMSVTAGSKIKWIFVNQDDMPHNCLIVEPNAATPVGEKALRLGVKGMSMDYVPKDERVIYHTTLIQPGSSQTIYFTAPDKPGVYEYVCTYPGHYLSMRGVLRVRAREER